MLLSGCSYMLKNIIFRVLYLPKELLLALNQTNIYNKKRPNFLGRLCKIMSTKL